MDFYKVFFIAIATFLLYSCFISFLFRRMNDNFGKILKLKLLYPNYHVQFDFKDFYLVKTDKPLTYTIEDVKLGYEKIIVRVRFELSEEK